MKKIVHHVGISVPTKEEYDRVVQALTLCGLHEIVDDADDHKRTYFEIGDGIYFEIQYFPPDFSTSPSSHIDIIKKRPLNLLRFLQSHHRFGTKWVDFGKGKKPRGKVRITDSLFSIMVRTIMGGDWTPGE